MHPTVLLLFSRFTFSGVAGRCSWLFMTQLVASQMVRWCSLNVQLFVLVIGGGNREKWEFAGKGKLCWKSNL